MKPQGDSHHVSHRECSGVAPACVRNVVTVPLRTTAGPKQLLEPADIFFRAAMALLATITLAAQLASPQTPPPSNSKRTQNEQTTPSREPAAIAATAERAAQPDAALKQKIEQIANTGRIQQIGESSSTRLNPAPPLAPGAPPILAFRYFDGQARHRFGDLDLVMDDAGH
jgi:hypothetical protein